MLLVRKGLTPLWEDNEGRGSSLLGGCSSTRSTGGGGELLLVPPPSGEPLVMTGDVTEQ